ncbi:MAG: O-antigen ligase family protein [Candidatus Omnitrophica bacterium]|nr:O-antigen ligase family protein [Candidatus Omnitrophota bacterium]
MNTLAVMDRIDKAIRFFIYTLVFVLPYSTAAVECCVIAASLLWIIKRSILARQEISQRPDLKEKVFSSLKSFCPKDNFLNVPIAFFLGACLLSTVGSAFFEVSLQGFIRKTLEWFAIYFLVLEVFTSDKYIRRFLCVVLLTTFLTCIDVLIQFYITGHDIFRGREVFGGRATGPFKQANMLGGYLACVSPLVFSALYVMRKKSCARYFMAVFFVFALWGVFISFSRGAWVGLGAGLVFGLWITKRKVAVMGIVGLLVLMFFSYSFLSAEMKHRFRVDPDNITATARWRVDLWKGSFKMIKDRPFFGHGLNIYMNLFQEYRTKLSGQFEYWPSYAHNCYIQIAAETGVVGLSCFLWIIGLFFKKAGERLEVFWQSGEEGVVFVGLTVGLFIFLVHSFFDTNFYSLQLVAFFWLLLGAAVAIYNNILKHSSICVTKET